MAIGDARGERGTVFSMESLALVITVLVGLFAFSGLLLIGTAYHLRRGSARTRKVLGILAVAHLVLGQVIFIGAPLSTRFAFALPALAAAAFLASA